MKTIKIHIRHGNVDLCTLHTGKTVAEALASVKSSYVIEPANRKFASVVSEIETAGKASHGWVDYTLEPDARTSPIIKTHLKKHYFTSPLYESGQEFAACAETPEKALLQFSEHGRDSWTLTRTEELPYLRAPFIAELLPHLGKGWGVEPQSEEFPDCGWYLKSPQGLEIFANIGKNYENRNGKVSFQYSRPTPKKGGYVEVYTEGPSYRKIPNPVIGVTFAKGAESIARDILKRLLPDCEALHPLVLKRIAEADAYQTKEEAAKAFAAANYSAKGPRIEAIGSEVRVFFDLSPERAAELLKLTANF